MAYWHMKHEVSPLLCLRQSHDLGYYNIDVNPSIISVQCLHQALNKNSEKCNPTTRPTDGGMLHNKYKLLRIWLWFRFLNKIA